MWPGVWPGPVARDSALRLPHAGSEPAVGAAAERGGLRYSIAVRALWLIGDQLIKLTNQREWNPSMCCKDARLFLQQSSRPAPGNPAARCTGEGISAGRGSPPRGYAVSAAGARGARGRNLHRSGARPVIGPQTGTPGHACTSPGSDAERALEACGTSG